MAQMSFLKPPSHRIHRRTRRGTYKKLGKRSALYKAKCKIEKAKAKVEHPFRVIKRQFGYVKPPWAAYVKSVCGERHGKRLTKSQSGMID